MENNMIVGIILIVLGVISRLTLTNNINLFFGYRTRRSMKNTTNWNFANKLSSIYIIITGLCTILASVIGYYTLPNKYQRNFVIIVLLIGLALSIFFTEKKLKEIDKKNNT